MRLLSRTAVHTAFYALSVLAIIYANPSPAQTVKQCTSPPHSRLSCRTCCEVIFKKCNDVPEQCHAHYHSCEALPPLSARQFP
jgi:hypothetical protein